MAAQAVISTCSKSKYYNGDLADDHLPEDLSANERDEIGIVWAMYSIFGPILVLISVYYVGPLFITAERTLQVYPSAQQ